MGSACCVAARDRTITSGSSRDGMPRTIRYSPSWSVRRDNRRRVAGEEASISCFSDDLGTNDRLENKSQTTAGTAYASEEGSPLESFRNQTWKKSSPSEGYMVPWPDQSVSQITSEVKGSSETQPASEPSPIMISLSTHSVSSPSHSPLSSSQPHFLPTSSRWHNRSPGCHLLRQVSDGRIPAMKSPSLSISEEGGSPFMLSGWSNEHMETSHSHRERWSFDMQTCGRTSGRVSSSPSIDMQTCGICSMLLTERTSWRTHKIMANEVAVVAILICGHVYHSECLESMTSEINKYDPVCPVCTFGEKKVIKLSEKAWKANLELKARNNKKSRPRLVDGDDIMFDHHKLRLISSMKSFIRKAFLKEALLFRFQGKSVLVRQQFSQKKRVLLGKVEQRMTLYSL